MKRSSFVTRARLVKMVALSIILLIGMVSGANAIIITPATQSQWSGTSPGNPQAGDIGTIVGLSSITFTELYKQDQGSEGSVGSFSTSYTTTFGNVPDDPADADIIYNSGNAFISGYEHLYLLVKDGDAHTPVWYLFDLLNLTIDGLPYAWNGTDPLQLRGFWPGPGAISHVAIYGDRVSVPEPGTLTLLGLSMVIIGLIRNRAKG